MTKWIKFKTRPFTDQELAEGYDRTGATGMWDCPIPEAEGEILVSDGETVVNRVSEALGITVEELLGGET